MNGGGSEGEINWYVYDGSGNVPRDVTHVRVDSSVAVIHGSAFRDSAFKDCVNLEEVELPEGLREIGAWAFDMCKSLSRITIPSTVTEIGSYAFYHCEKLEEAVLPDGLERLGDRAFFRCESLRRITIPPIECIKYGTFYYCNNLVEVMLSDGTREIGFGAFKCCTSLKAIHLPSSLRVVGRDAFSRCEGLAAFEDCQNLVEVELPEGLLEIGNEAFDGCKSLPRIAIPSTVTKIGNYAFKDCEKLEEAVLPDGLESLGQGAFSQCKSLRRITIPPIECIEYCTFTYCTSLAEVKLSEGTREIGAQAFMGCTSLRAIHLPSSLRVVGSEAFIRCEGLTEMILPDQVNTVGRKAFVRCNFQNFRVPPAMTTVDMGAFVGNNGMVSIELPQSVDQIECNFLLHRYHQSLALIHLRNLAIGPGCSFNLDILKGCKDLSSIFQDSDIREISNALQHRFDSLPIHELCYYHSYHPAAVAMSVLRWEIGTSMTFNATGKQRDCLGMTPLHILACSTKQDLEMFQLLVEKYSESLVAKDKWGCIPLLYAFWCNAPEEIILFLVKSHKSLFPDHALDWHGMIVTLVRARKPVSSIQNLINAQRESFPNQSCDLQSIVMELAKAGQGIVEFIDSWAFLLRASTLERLDSLNVSRWREDMQNRVNECLDVEVEVEWRGEQVRALYARLAAYESMKEGSSILELALWKAKIEARGDGAIGHREQCRINCGADIVIRNVLSYLCPSSSSRAGSGGNDSGSDSHSD